MLTEPNSNGILEFVLGFLFMLFTYHALLFWQHKNRVYLYYSLYVGLILLGSIQFLEQGFFYELILPINPILIKFDAFFRWLYNSVYFLFAFGFIELAKYSRKWEKIMKLPVYVLLIIGVVLQVISLIKDDISIIHESFFLFFIPLIVLHSLIGYYVLFTIKTPLRYYIIVGSLFLFVTSVTGAVLYYLELLPKDNHLRDSIFYFGVIVENIFFALGIGHKQRFLQEEKNRMILAEKERGLRAVIETQEKERTSIAKDLHDGVIQQIGAISILLDKAIPNLDQESSLTIQKAQKAALDAAKETRLISHQMMPKVLTMLGLEPAMKDVAEFVEQHGIKVSFQTNNLKKRYPNNIEIVVYRIFQELTNNIIKHSEATAVDVQLYQSKAQLILLLEDNGIGMPKRATKGIGLYNIESRLSTVKGKIEYTKRPNGGTTTTVFVPI